MRHWIIGNGQSLKETPLHLLKDEPFTWGMNNIDLAYKWTDWRPTRYIKTEWMDGTAGYKSTSYHISKHIPSYINSNFFDRVWHNTQWVWPPVLIPIRIECHHSGSNAFHGNPPATWHLPRLCCFASTVNAAAQIAVMDGADELVFVGCDLGYKWYNKLKDPDPNHFDDSYGEADMFPIEERDPTLILMHEIIQRECQERGIKVYNATVGGKLEVYPRKSIEEIING
jgi:hypothetical protein